MKRVVSLAVLALVVVFVGSAIAQDPIKDRSQDINRVGPPVYTPRLPSPFCSQPGIVILDNTQFTDQIVIPDNFVITDLDVSLDITHTFLGDLEISIDNGVDTVDLLWDDCVSNDDVSAYTVDDSAGAIPCGTPLTGSGVTTSNNPAQEFLSVFNGQNIGGTWTLTVNDDAGGDTGVLNEWCIITTPIPVELKGLEVE